MKGVCLLNHRSYKKPFISTGVTSIVLIFILLCMLTFSVLSLVTAQADLRLSQKSADRTTNYYKAENAANDILLEVIRTMESELSVSDASVFYQRVQQQLDGKYGITFSDSEHLNYQVPLEDTQHLEISLTISFTPFENGKRYRIDSWNTNSDYDWSPDTSLPLM